MTTVSGDGHKRAVLYARVSTDEQAKEDKTSIETQIEECRKYAERIGYTIVAEFREDFTSTVPMVERPEGRKLTDMLTRRDAEAVIARRVNRLSRDVVDLMVTARQWLRAGVEIHIAQHGRKVEREDDIVFMFEGWQGTQERKDIVERATEALYNKARSGRVVGTGNAPYGYRYGKGCLIIVEEEAKVVRLIFIWYTEGDERGKPLPLHAISRRLSELKIPTPVESGRKGARVRGAGIWNDSTVRGILMNETYCGVWRYGKTKSAGRQGNVTRSKQGVENQVAVAVPAIIDRETWERAQERRAYNKRMAQRNCRHDYLLRGMIRCGCGKAMVGDTVRGPYSYYCCTSHYHYYAGIEQVACSEKPVRCDAADEAAWNYILGLLKDAGAFESAIRDAQKAELDTLAPKRERLETVLSLIADCDREAKNYAQEIGRAGGAMRRALEVQIADVEKRYAALTIERDELKAQLDTQRLTEHAIQAALRFREDMIERLQAATFEDKRRVLELLQAQVTVKDRQVRTTCLIPSEYPIAQDFAKVAFDKDPEKFLKQGPSMHMMGHGH